MAVATTFALIDYDNVIIAKDERCSLDVRNNLTILVNEIVLFVSSRVPSTEELIVRIYGGWLTKTNEYTARATWLLTEIPTFRRRFGRLRVKPNLTDAMLAFPDAPLCGTYRKNSEIEQQKMVDGMIAIDMLCIAQQIGGHIILVSDDDDFVPALMYCAYSKRKQQSIFLKRKSASNIRLNDHNLISLNIEIGG